MAARGRGREAVAARGGRPWRREVAGARRETVAARGRGREPGGREASSWRPWLEEEEAGK
jgi:hypothetical protein